MKYNNMYLNRDYRLTDNFTKNLVIGLGLKSYEVNHLHREGYSFHDIVTIASKFNNNHTFCSFVRTHLLKNCWWD